MNASFLSTRNWRNCSVHTYRHAAPHCLRRHSSDHVSEDCCHVAEFMNACARGDSAAASAFVFRRIVCATPLQLIWSVPASVSLPSAICSDIASLQAHKFIYMSPQTIFAQLQSAIPSAACSIR